MTFRRVGASRTMAEMWNVCLSNVGYTLLQFSREGSVAFAACSERTGRINWNAIGSRTVKCVRESCH